MTVTVEGQDSRPPALSLRAHDINLDGPDGVFAEDCLRRQPAVELLCDVLATTESPAVVALNGKFGSGKSTFLKMCIAVLRQREVTVVDIDAWQQRYTGDALVDLIGALSDAIPTEQERLHKVLRLAGRIARGAAWNAVGHLSGGVLAPVDSSTADTSPIADWHKFKEARDELREVIGDVATAQADRIVFVIDELDRCPPAYALDMLDRVRNVLDIPGIVVLFGITRSQLVHAVRQEQGASCDAGAYLARFFDREIQLRTPSSVDTSNLIRRETSRLPHLTEFQRSPWGTSWGELLQGTAELLGARLRDIQQFLCAADTVLWLARDQAQVTALMLLTLRHVDRDIYDDFIARNIDGYAAASAFNSVAPSIFRESTTLIPWLQALLILCSLGRSAAVPSAEVFQREFGAAGAGTVEQATEAYEALGQLYQGARNRSTVKDSLAYLVSLVEMSEPPA
jgi:energy-coupling factor transporter ATP-binding protein EcfA2